MAQAKVNGKIVNIPDNATDADIRKAGGIAQGRTLMRKDGPDSTVIPPGSRVDVQDGDDFVDAPSRTKG